MTDLAQRLRLTSFPCCQEAANRIEALEAALREITEGSFVTDTAYDAIRIARAALAPEQEK
jgi:hypothetical protein